MFQLLQSHNEERKKKRLKSKDIQWVPGEETIEQYKTCFVKETKQAKTLGKMRCLKITDQVLLLIIMHSGDRRKTLSHWPQCTKHNFSIKLSLNFNRNLFFSTIIIIHLYHAQRTQHRTEKTNFFTLEEFFFFTWTMHQESLRLLDKDKFFMQGIYRLIFDKRKQRGRGGTGKGVREKYT